MKIFDREYFSPKGYLSGTHRVRSPSETLRQFSPLMPRMGITRLANVTGLDCIGIPVFMAVRPTSRVLSVSQGKGLDRDSAAASALMESIEYWHAERLVAPSRFDSYQWLRREGPVVDIDALWRTEPAPVPRDRPLLWVEGYELFEQRRTWLPEECVGLNMVLPRGHRSLFLRNGNGLASGNHMLEALVHALCELIERDAVSLWYLDDDSAHTKSTQIDLATVKDPACRSCIDRIEAAGICIGAWDATSDIGIPTYVATLVDEPGAQATGAFNGYGCHLAPEIALLRALTEAVQSRLTHISGSRDDMLPDSYNDRGQEDPAATFREEINNPSPVRSFGERRSMATETFEGDAAVLLQALHASSIPQVVAVDFSRADVGIPVIKVIAPGLEGYHAHSTMPGPRALARLEHLSRAES